MKKYALLLAVLSATLLLTGCYSDAYYQDQAVQRAREYLLEEMPQIPILEQEYIKFNSPVILADQISTGYSTGVAQICITWLVPDDPECYMVYGASSVRMMDWKPQRIIRKSFSKNPDGDYLKAAGKASKELLQSQFALLTVPSVNHIRYTLPGVWKCKFPLNSNPGVEIAAAELAAAEKLPRYVLAWKITEKDKVIYAVYGGTARNDRLEGFKSYFSGLYTEEDFKANILEAQPLREPFGGISE